MTCYCQVMANAALKMKGPTKIIDLDGIPSKDWKLESKAVHLYKGKLWTKEAVGCCLCVAKEGPEFVTLCTTDEDGVDHLHCMEHGELVPVKYSMKKVYTITIGDITRDGEETLDDVMLFPAEMTLAARNEVINGFLDQGQKEEVEAGAAPLEDMDD